MKFKKILCFVLVGIMALNVSALYAAYKTEVRYVGTGVEGYELSVPAMLEPGTSGDVVLTGTWPSNRKVTVTADKTVTLTGSLGGEVTLDIDFTGIEQSGDNFFAISRTESVTVEEMSALFGTWTGEFYYHVSASDVGSSSLDDGLNDDGLNDDGLNNDGLNDDGLNDDGLNDDGLNDSPTETEVSLTSLVTMKMCSLNEFVALCDATNEENSLMYWKDMGTMVSHPDYPEPGDGSFHYHTHMAYSKTYLRQAELLPNCGPSSEFGLRPSFTSSDPSAMDELYSVGDYVTMGTLYMGNTPVKVPQNPVDGGDITEYIDGTTITLREALDDEDYQLKAFYVGDGVFVADRVMLIQISYIDIDIEGALA